MHKAEATSPYALDRGAGKMHRYSAVQLAWVPCAVLTDKGLLGRKMHNLGDEVQHARVLTVARRLEKMCRNAVEALRLWPRFPRIAHRVPKMPYPQLAQVVSRPSSSKGHQWEREIRGFKRGTVLQIGNVLVLYQASWVRPL